MAARFGISPYARHEKAVPGIGELFKTTVYA
jgi:hypothetical protein